MLKTSMLNVITFVLSVIFRIFPMKCTVLEGWKIS